MDPSPSFPFPEAETSQRPAPSDSVSPIHSAAFRGAVTGADAYRGVRLAVRLEGNLLRVGNRFVRLERYREIAFLAIGTAATSQAMALNDVLADRLTQGFLASPFPVPKQLNFRSVLAPSGWPGEPGMEGIRASAQELCEDLGERDLLIALVSPGALGVLGAPPTGIDAAAWRTWLEELYQGGLTGADVGRVVRVLGDGLVGGGLAKVAGRAEIETLEVDRGDGASVGGGPTRPVFETERREVRALLARAGVVDRLDPALRARLDSDPTRAQSGAATNHRPVVISGPADALAGAASAVGERKWMPRLAGLYLAGDSAGVASDFLSRLEVMGRQYAETVREAKRLGLVAFAMSTLGLPEGVDERPFMAPWIRSTVARLAGRDATIGLMRTAGGHGELPPGLVATADGRVQSLPMPAGVTDVGLLLVAVLPLASRSA